MGNNALVRNPPKEEIAELESVVQDRLDSIQQSIIHKEKSIEKRWVDRSYMK